MGLPLLITFSLDAIMGRDKTMVMTVIKLELVITRIGIIFGFHITTASVIDII